MTGHGTVAGQLVGGRWDLFNIVPSPWSSLGIAERLQTDGASLLRWFVGGRLGDRVGIRCLTGAVGRGPEELANKIK